MPLLPEIQERIDKAALADADARGSLRYSVTDVLGRIQVNALYVTHATLFDLLVAIRRRLRHDPHLRSEALALAIDELLVSEIDAPEALPPKFTLGTTASMSPDRQQVPTQAVGGHAWTVTAPRYKSKINPPWTEDLPPGDWRIPGGV